MILNLVSLSNPVPFALPDASSLENNGLELWIFKQIAFFTVCCNYHSSKSMSDRRVKIGKQLGELASVLGRKIS